MSEEQAEQLMQQMQMLETYFSDLSQREGTFLNIMREAVASIESIKSLDQKPESETLVPIGMGTYVQAKILSNTKIVMNIGAGIAVEKDFSSAINYLEARIKEVEVALHRSPQDESRGSKLQLVRRRIRAWRAGRSRRAHHG